MGLGARIPLERARQVAIDFDHVHVFRARQKVPGQRATARSDFHDALTIGGRHRIDDPADHTAIMQEVLAEALAYRHDS
jgi:hypothetical protein